MRVLRLPDVQAKVGLRHSAIYQRMNENTFPRPIPLDGKAKGWLESEIDNWIAEQVAKRDGAAA